MITGRHYLSTCYYWSFSDSTTPHSLFPSFFYFLLSFLPSFIPSPFLFAPFLSGILFRDYASYCLLPANFLFFPFSRALFREPSSHASYWLCKTTHFSFFLSLGPVQITFLPYFLLGHIITYLTSTPLHTLVVCTSTFLHPEDGGSMVLHNTGMQPPHDMAQQQQQQQQQ